MKSFTEYAQSRDVELGHTDLDEGLGGNLWNAAKGFGQQALGGIKAGFGQAANAMTGPVARYDAAINALTTLNKTMQGLGPNILAQIPQGSQTAQIITNLLQTLNQQKQMIPRLTAQTASNQWNAGPAGGVQGNVGDPSAAAGATPPPIPAAAAATG